jgi:hypothetical protein
LHGEKRIIQAQTTAKPNQVNSGPDFIVICVGWSARKTEPIGEKFGIAGFERWIECFAAARLF